MFAMPLVYSQQLVADRQRSYEADASRRRMRRQARQQSADATVGIRRPGRAPLATPMTAPIIRDAAFTADLAPCATPASKVA
jgi:hypothetical protein